MDGASTLRQDANWGTPSLYLSPGGGEIVTRDGHLAFRVRRPYHAAHEFQAVCSGVLDADDD